MNRAEILHEEQMKRTREINRLAARRKRQRKKEQLQSLENRHEELLQQRIQLEHELSSYRSVNDSANQPIEAVEPDSLREEVMAVCHEARSVVAALSGLNAEISLVIRNMESEKRDTHVTHAEADEKK